MSTHTDSYNGGHINYIYGTNPSGDVFNLGAGQDYCYGDGNDQYNLMYINGYLSPYGNIFDSAGTIGNSINLLGYGVDLFLANFTPLDCIQNIYGYSGGSYISADQSNSQAETLDFSQTNLYDITRIDGNSGNDTFRGSGQSGILISGGSGNDTIYESGTDTLSESRGYDQVNGGGGTNTYIASGNLATYTPGLSSGGQILFHSGTNWDFFDAAGYTIQLANIQSVQFNDVTITSTMTTIPVADSNSATNTIALNAATGTLVGITADDVNPIANGANITYSLLNANGSPFTINAKTGVVSVANGFLIDGSVSSYSITVQGTDGTTTVQSNFTIAVTQPANTLIGTSGNDTLTAPSSSNWTLEGLTGNDTITGSTGNDLLSGGAGVNTLTGGGGNEGRKAHPYENVR